MNSGSKVLLGVLAGAATGAILGVLFAPGKGEETRRRLSEGGRDITGNLKERSRGFMDAAVNRFEAVKESAAGLVEQGRAKASSVAGGVKSGASNLASHATGVTGSHPGTTGLGAGISALGSNVTE